MSRVFDAIGSAMLQPALRLMRDRLGAGADVAAMRRVAARADRLAPAEPGVSRRDETIGDAGLSWLEVDGVASDRVILYFHGGAFVIETPATHGAFLARLCRGTAARGAMVNYRLAPEHPYPAAADDCLAAYRHLLDAGVAPQCLAFVGDSAGGNLMLATLLRAREAGLPLPAAAVALSPLTDATLGGDSMLRNEGRDPMFTAAMLQAVAPHYFRDPARRTEPGASPLRGDLTALPPILLQVGSSELLLDDSVRFALRCPSAMLEVWHDMPHVFPTFPFLPEAKEAVDRICGFIDEHVGARRPAARKAKVAVALRDADRDARVESSAAPASRNAAAGVALRGAAAAQAGPPGRRRAARRPGRLSLAPLFAVLALTAIALEALLAFDSAAAVPPVGWAAALLQGSLPGAPLLMAAVMVLALVVADRRRVGMRGGARWRWMAVAVTLLAGPGAGLGVHAALRARDVPPAA